MRQYGGHDVPVQTAWLEEQLGGHGVRVAEVDVDTTTYATGHIPGAVGWNWQTDLCDTTVRDIIPKGKLEELLGRSGIDRDTTVVLYGDHSNWFACWAFWQLKIFGHPDVRILDGGRSKWLAESRPLTTRGSRPEPRTYSASEPDLSLRAFLPLVMESSNGARTLVDVRSPEEFSGELLSPPGLPETCQRGGHIPGAKNVPWGLNCRDDGTFKSPHELEELYGLQGVTADQSVITYCRIGERSSLTWFVLKYLLGYTRVVNYDGSWTEWGNLVAAPVATGSRP